MFLLEIFPLSIKFESFDSGHEIFGFCRCMLFSYCTHLIFGRTNSTVFPSVVYLSYYFNSVFEAIDEINFSISRAS